MKKWRNIPFGSKVVLLRESKGWSQKDLARASNITQATISRIESGKLKGLHCCAFLRLARALGATMEALLDSDGTGGLR